MNLNNGVSEFFKRLIIAGQGEKVEASEFAVAIDEFRIVDDHIEVKCTFTVKDKDGNILRNLASGFLRAKSSATIWQLLEPKVFTITVS